MHYYYVLEKQGDEETQNDVRLPSADLLHQTAVLPEVRPGWRQEEGSSSSPSTGEAGTQIF